MDDDDSVEPQQLLQKPRDYNVKFSFPDPSPLQPPILGLHSKFLSMVIKSLSNHRLSTKSFIMQVQVLPIPTKNLYSKMLILVLTSVLEWLLLDLMG